MRVMIIDDEPIFIYNLREVLQSCAQKLGLELEIVAECYSAEMALQEIPNARPDLIYTDVRMHTMNGLDLAQIIKEQYPQMAVVIVSGYPSFDTARLALKANVTDYLVKPIEYVAVLETVTKINEQLLAGQYMAKQAKLHELIESEALSEGLAGQLEEMGKENRRHYAVGLYSSIFQYYPFLYDLQSEEHNVHLQAIQHILQSKGNVWIIPFAYLKGVLFVVEMEEEHEGLMEQIAAYIGVYYADEQFSSLVGWSAGVHSMLELKETSMKLMRALESKHVIGKSQVLPPEELDHESPAAFTFISDVQRNTIRYLYKKNDWEAIERQLQEWFSVWENERCPTIYIEMEMRKVIEVLEEEEARLDPRARKEKEQFIAVTLFESQQYSEAGKAIGAWLQMQYKRSSSAVESKGELLFQQMQQYIEAHLAEPLTIQVLTELFHISSTYLCNLFRMYGNQSFVEYLTERRIEKAKGLLLLERDIPVKEISDIVGYSDRHYFSKVFKLNVGMTPSEYRSAMKEK